MMYVAVEPESAAALKERYECPHFRILVIGRANAGKTTILEKICGVGQGTKPIIYDENGIELEADINFIPKPNPMFKFLQSIKQVFKKKAEPSQMHLTPLPPVTHLMPSIEVSCMHIDPHPLISNQLQRGIHDIEHQITYPGSNFIFHDSQGFESGASGEIEIVWSFIEKRSTAVNMKDQLHAIWYHFIWV